MTRRPPDPPPPFAAFFANVARLSVAAPILMLLGRFLLPASNFSAQSSERHRGYLWLTILICLLSASAGLWCAASTPGPVRTAGVMTTALAGIIVSIVVLAMSALILSML